LAITPSIPVDCRTRILAWIIAGQESWAVFLSWTITPRNADLDRIRPALAEMRVRDVGVYIDM
jgi:hypothetical protein